MKILIWIIVALVIIGGIAWFMSGDETSTTNSESAQQNTQITQSGSIESDDQVLTEIDRAINQLG